MPNSEPDYAAAEILCDPAQLVDLEAIANLEIRLNPRYTDDPARILVHALADDAARAAAAALGCTVTVVKTSAELQDQLDSAYAGLPVDPSAPEDPAEPAVPV